MSVRFSSPVVTLTLPRELRTEAARMAAVRGRRHRDREIRDNARAAAATLVAGGDVVVLPAAQAMTLLAAVYVGSATSPAKGTQAEAILAVRRQLEPMLVNA